MNEYQPELGQMLFGQPSQPFSCPEIFIAVLEKLATEYDRVGWNIHQREIENPFYNHGPAYNLKTDVFEVCAYSWTTEGQEFNFAWRDLRVSWYKWCSRGASSNVEITPDMAAQCLEECLVSLNTLDQSHDQKVNTNGIDKCD